MEKVTVIIPVYNSEKYIRKCVESVINQTCKNIKILLINDGSTDKSKEILEKYRNEYKNIEVINQNNKGVAETRNEAIMKVNTKYLMFIDNDDFIDSNYIETYINSAEENNYDIVMGGYRRVNCKGKIMFKEKLKDTPWSKYIILAPWAKIYKTSFLRENNISFFDYKIGEDVYFNILAYSKNPKIKIIDYIGYNWFFNDVSVSNTSQRGLNDQIDIRILLNGILKNVKKRDRLLNYYLYRYCVWYLLFSGRKSDYKQFIKHYQICHTWLVDNKIGKEISLISNEIKGEKMKNRAIITVFYIIEKLNLITLFAKLYCKEVKE